MHASRVIRIVCESTTTTHTSIEFLVAFSVLYAGPVGRTSNGWRAKIGTSKNGYDPRAKLSTSIEQNWVRSESKIKHESRAKLSTNRGTKVCTEP